MVTKYQNGGWEVSIDSVTGDKSRRLIDRGNPLPIFPESMDLKVTDYCNAGCAFCHEDSTLQGKHADLLETQEALADLPAGVEIAIGGGDPLSWPHLDNFLKWCADRGLFANITVNGLHVRRGAPRLKALQSNGLIHGIGVSAVSNGYNTRAFNIEDIYGYGLKNVVGHIIMGRVDFSQEPPYDQNELMPSYLLLGFKDFGRGVLFKDRRGYAEVNLKKMRRWVLCMHQIGIKVSFDNLALEQGHLQELVEPSVWKSMYMGPDGMFTMFVDAVRKEWSVSSTTPRQDRVPWDHSDLRQFFAKTTRSVA